MALASAQILCGNLQDAVGVDEKFHFDARQAGGRRRNLQRETSERTAISPEVELSVGECLLDGPHGSVNHRANEGFKLGARKLQSEICTVRKRKEQTLVSVLRKPMLERDEPLAELLGELAVWGKIKLVVLENLLVHKGLEQIVDVIAAEVCAAISG